MAAIIPKIMNKMPPIRVICFSEILPAITPPPITAMRAHIACPNIAPPVTPIALLPAANAIVAICVRSPHSAIKVNTNDLSKTAHGLVGRFYRPVQKL